MATVAEGLAKKQFAMIKPASKHVDVGLILPGKAVTGRLESAKTFNALFTRRVRVSSPAEVDKQLVAWLHEAYEAARDGAWPENLRRLRRGVGSYYLADESQWQR